MSGFFKIRKISDLTRLWILPVMILSIFLSFYLYVDMEKIQSKSEDLVDSVIPHVLNAQQSAICLEQLRRNIELVSMAPDLTRARGAYVDIRRLIGQSELSKDPDLYQSSNDLLFEVNRLWKLRLQLDELRVTVHSSLHFMDTVMYLIYNDHSELFPEIDRHVSNYIDLYKTGDIGRDLYGEHRNYYNMMRERLAADFDQKAFIKEHPAIINPTPSTPIQNAGMVTRSKNKNMVIMQDESERKLLEQKKIQDQSLALIATALDTISTLEQDADGVAATESKAERGSEQSEQTNGILDASISTSELAVSAPAAGAAAAASEVASGDIAAAAGAAATAGAAGRNSLVADPARVKGFDGRIPQNIDVGKSAVSKMNQAEQEAVTRAMKYVLNPSNMQDMKMLSIYKQELDRFDPMWTLYLKIQDAFSRDSQAVLSQVDEIAQNFTMEETHALHEELKDIAYLASESKPMVMATIAFCLLGLCAVIFMLNRYLMEPLKDIARILIRFRQTKSVNVKQYQRFFGKHHLVEIREIIDVLPQIFEDYSDIKEQSTELKQRYDELLTHSKFDALTKVYNRGSLNMLIQKMGANTPSGFAILMVDIDFFKHLNDSMGHQRGDEVLFAVAQTLQNHIAKKDRVFRYGGEEFCVILADVTEENAVKVAERLCTTVRNMGLINEGVESGIVTISIGMSVVTHMEKQFRIEEMISQADKALYIAKRNGRNRVVVCPKEMVYGMEPELSNLITPAVDDSAIPTSISHVDQNKMIEDTEEALEAGSPMEQALNQVDAAGKKQDKSGSRRLLSEQKAAQAQALAQLSAILDEDEVVVTRDGSVVRGTTTGAAGGTGSDSELKKQTAAMVEQVATALGVNDQDASYKLMRARVSARKSGKHVHDDHTTPAPADPQAPVPAPAPASAAAAASDPDAAPAPSGRNEGANEAKSVHGAILSESSALKSTEHQEDNSNDNELQYDEHWDFDPSRLDVKRYNHDPVNVGEFLFKEKNSPSLINIDQTRLGPDFTSDRKALKQALDVAAFDAVFDSEAEVKANDKEQDQAKDKSCSQDSKKKQNSKNADAEKTYEETERDKELQEASRLLSERIDKLQQPVHHNFVLKQDKAQDKVKATSPDPERDGPTVHEDKAAQAARDASEPDNNERFVRQMLKDVVGEDLYNTLVLRGDGFAGDPLSHDSSRSNQVTFSHGLVGCDHFFDSSKKTKVKKDKAQGKGKKSKSGDSSMWDDGEIRGSARIPSPAPENMRTPIKPVGAGNTSQNEVVVPKRKW